MAGSSSNYRGWSYFLAGLLFFAPGPARALPQFDCHTAEDCDPGEYCRIPEQHDAGTSEDAAPEDANFDAGWSGYCAISFDGGAADSSAAPPMRDDAGVADAAAADAAAPVANDAGSSDPPMGDAALADGASPPRDAAAGHDSSGAADASVSAVDASAEDGEGMSGGSCDCAQGAGAAPWLGLLGLIAAAGVRRRRQSRFFNSW